MFAYTLSQILILSLVFTLILQGVDYNMVKAWLCLEHRTSLLWWFTTTNNLYQAVMHVTTAKKFLNLWVPFVPGGAADHQSVASFTLHNQLNIWGWFGYLLLRNSSNWVYSTLTGVHMSVALVVFANPPAFQAYYIRNEAPVWFQWFKIGFVLFDAICRTYAVLRML
jgi:hypothetical protein